MKITNITATTFFVINEKAKKKLMKLELGEGNKTFNCDVCRKDLGDTIQIFRCPNHEEIILKVWGVLEGENKEKIFYKECPKEGQQEKQLSETIGKRALWLIGGGIVLIGGLVLIVYWFFKRGRDD